MLAEFMSDQQQNIEQPPTAQHDPLSITEKSHLQLSADSLEGEWSGITRCFMQWLSEYDSQLDVEEKTAKKAKMSEWSPSGVVRVWFRRVAP